MHEPGTGNNIRHQRPVIILTIYSFATTWFVLHPHSDPQHVTAATLLTQLLDQAN
jgi:hypothetical protein